MEDRNRPLYMISVAAELAGVHPQTLRIYEQKGLVSPQRTSGNTRMYSQADIERLELINELTSEGINLAGVIRILDLKGRLDERDEEIDDLHRRVRRFGRSRPRARDARKRQLPRRRQNASCSALARHTQVVSIRRIERCTRTHPSSVKETVMRLDKLAMTAQEAFQSAMGIAGDAETASVERHPPAEGVCSIRGRTTSPPLSSASGPTLRS